MTWNVSNSPNIRARILRDMFNPKIRSTMLLQMVARFNYPLLSPIETPPIMDSYTYTIFDLGQQASPLLWTGAQGITSRKPYIYVMSVLGELSFL